MNEETPHKKELLTCNEHDKPSHGCAWCLETCFQNVGILKAKNEFLEDQIASAADFANTWARESNVMECTSPYHGLFLRNLISRLQDKCADTRLNLTAQLSEEKAKSSRLEKFHDQRGDTITAMVATISRLEGTVDAQEKGRLLEEKLKFEALAELDESNAERKRLESEVKVCNWRELQATLKIEKLGNELETFKKEQPHVDEMFKKLAEVEKENREMREGLIAIHTAILARATDTIWFSDTETVRDYIQELLERTKEK